MSETTAAHVARLRLQYGSRFRIERNEGRFTARDRASGRTISASSPGELEVKLIRASWRLVDHGSTRRWSALRTFHELGTLDRLVCSDQISPTVRPNRSTSR
jgi:hypothetical protein